MAGFERQASYSALWWTMLQGGKYYNINGYSGEANTPLKITHVNPCKAMRMYAHRGSL